MESNLGLNETDDLILEYLLYRGFTQTFRVFSQQKKQDRLKELKTDQIIEQLFIYIHSFDDKNLYSLWDFLTLRFFNHLDMKFADDIKMFYVSLRRYYIVNAIKTKNVNQALLFLQSNAEELLSDVRNDERDSWRIWFSLPYLPNPDLDSYFAPFFQDEWMKSLKSSLQNLFILIFQNLPPPKLIAFNLHRMQQHSLTCELNSARNEIKRLKHQLEKAEQKSKSTEGVMQDMMKFVHRRKSSLSGNMKVRNASVEATNINATSTSPPIITSSHSNQSQYSPPLDEVRLSNIDDLLHALDDSSSSDEDEESDDLIPLMYTGSDQPTAKRKSKESRESGRTARSSSTQGVFTKWAEEKMTGHAEPISLVRFSRNGKFIASGSDDATLRVWSLSSERERVSHYSTVFVTDSITSMDWVFSTDQLLLFGTKDGSVKMFNVANKRVVMEMNTDQKLPHVKDIVCSSSSTLFVTSLASSNGDKSSLLTWDLKTNKVIHPLPVDPSPSIINSMAFSKDGNILAAAGDDGMIRLFDINTSRAIMGWPAFDCPATCVKFSPDENSILSCDAKGQVVEWNIKRPGYKVMSYDQIGKTKKYNVKQQRHDISFVHSNKHFATTSMSEDVVLYEYSSPHYVQLLSGHTNNVVSLDFMPNQENPILISGSLDHNVMLRRFKYKS